MYASLNTWNNYGSTVGGVTFATDTILTTLDLEVRDAGTSTDWFVGAWDDNYSPNRITLNPYYMSKYDANTQKSVITHELGHALGLGHSVLGQIMNSYTTSVTSLGSQDMSDYDYWWR